MDKEQSRGGNVADTTGVPGVEAYASQTASPCNPEPENLHVLIQQVWGGARNFQL